MTDATETPTETPKNELAPETIEFYREAMWALEQAGVPFLVGGAYAFARYTGVVRYTKDFDVFVRPADFERALEAFARKGWTTERSFPHWLGKTYRGEDFVDVIFSSGNGVARVDEVWFEKAVPGKVLDHPVLLVPAEEMIWSKSFIMERERFDGADVAHVLRCCAPELDWERLLRRFEADGGWRVLFAHLVLFGYIYPGDAGRIPRWVFDRLIERLRDDTADPEGDPLLCRGPILSRSQYLIDLLRWGYNDARLRPAGNMSLEEIEQWTVAAEKDGDITQYQALEDPHSPNPLSPAPSLPPSPGERGL
jgi:putative nucleotidyltransferase-like protein